VNCVRPHTRRAHQKLLQAHYAGAVIEDLLATEMQRLTRHLAEADREIRSAQSTTADIEQPSTRHLRQPSNVAAAYANAPNKIRGRSTRVFPEAVHRGGRVGR
jgi:hypothetical protein